MVGVSLYIIETDRNSNRPKWCQNTRKEILNSCWLLKTFNFRTIWGDFFIKIFDFFVILNFGLANHLYCRPFSIPGDKYGKFVSHLEQF